jgi:hypothetical protein
MLTQLSDRSPYDLILTGFGLLQLLIAAIAVLLAATFVLRSESAEGIVVAFRESPKTAKSKTPVANPPVAPVIEFTPSGGEPVRIVSSFYERTPSSALGDIVPVRYRPSAPEEAVVDVFSDKWAMPFFFGLVGFGFLAVARLFRRRPA